MNPLQTARKKLKLTQAELAKLSGVDQGFISRLEKNTVKASAESAAKLVAAMGGCITEQEILFPDRPFEIRDLPEVIMIEKEVAKQEPTGWKLVQKKLTQQQVAAAQKAAQEKLTVGNLWKAFLDNAPKYKRKRKAK